jgi:hypothetical protein
MGLVALARALLAALVLAALAAAPAVAAPPWSDPQVVAGSERPAAERAWPALAARGEGLLGWSVTDDPSDPDAVHDGRVAPITSAGPAAPEVSLDPYDLAAPAATYGGTRAILLQSRLQRSGESRLVVVFGRSDGVLGPRRALDRAVVLGGADLAANDRGDAVAAWIERRDGADRLWAAVRRPNGRFGTPEVLAGSGEITALCVGVGERGDAVVAYERRSGARAPRRVAARVRRAGGRFGPAADLGPSDGRLTLDAAVSRRGRVYVAWGTQDRGEAKSRPWRVLVAVRPAGPRRFGAAQVLDPGGGAIAGKGRVALGVADDQSATAAWTSARLEPGGAATYPVLTATTDRRGRFADAVPVAGALGALGAIATAPSGATTLLLLSEGDAPAVLASTRSAGATAFGPLETVSAAPAAPASSPVLAVDPRDGRLLAAWVGAGTTGVLTSSRPPG